MIVHKTAYGLICLSFLGILAAGVPGNCQIDFPHTSLALKYQPEHTIPISYRTAKSDTSFVIFLKIGYRDGTRPDQDYQLTYELKSEYFSTTSISSRTASYYLHGLGKDGDNYFYRISIPFEENTGLVLIRLKEIETGIIHIRDIPLQTEFNEPPAGFYLNHFTMDLPFCDTYLHKQETIVIHGISTGQTGKYFVFHYRSSFTPADPPMYRINKNISRSLGIDSSFVIDGDMPFNLDKTGLYFIQSDTGSLAGIGFRVEERSYPKLTKIEDLTGPVIYLSTRQENEILKSSNDPKKAFDKFWLGLSTSQSSAREIIKSYYDRVEMADRLFTNYKMGWKNDMGMVYLIFGTPDDVYNNGETETWYYKKNSSSPIVVFNFIRIKSPFTINQYTLLRDRKYKSIWYKAIDNWRKGRK